MSRLYQLIYGFNAHRSLMYSRAFHLGLIPASLPQFSLHFISHGLPIAVFCYFFATRLSHWGMESFKSWFYMELRLITF